MRKNIDLLLVDADEFARRRHARALAAARCRVKSVGNDAEALLELEKASYDIVLLDLPLPGPDGLALLGAIKRRWPDSEVVALASQPEIETAVEAIRLGAFDYLPKTIGPAEVAEVVGKAVIQKEWTLRRERIAA